MNNREIISLGSGDVMLITICAVLCVAFAVGLILWGVTR